MLNIKSMFLSFFAYSFLSGAFILLFLGSMVYTLPDHFQKATDVIENEMIDLMTKALGEDIKIFQGTDFEEIKLNCKTSEYIDHIENHDEKYISRIICEKINEGEVKDIHELKISAAKELVKEQIKPYLDIVNRDMVYRQRYYVFFGVGFIILLMIGAGFIFLDDMHLGKFTRNISMKILIINIPIFLGIIILFMVGGSIIDRIISGELSTGVFFLEEKIDESIYSAVQTSIGSFMQILILPLITHTLLAVLGLVGWLTGFGIPNKK